MTRAPDRKRDVYFVGAGFSCAAGLPNTAQLLSEVHRLAADKPAWGVSNRLEERLQAAYEFFYPTRGPGFRPEVVDFFSVLTSYTQIDQGGLPQGFGDRALLTGLKFAVAHLLCEATKQVTTARLAQSHELLDRMIRRGNVIVTTNWDTLIERACNARDVPYRLWGAPADSELTILKLHGSIDWLLRKDAKRSPVSKVTYASLEDLENSERARHRPLQKAPVIRTRVERPGALWQTIKGSTRNPYMITMAPGKADSLGPLLDLWSAAYRGISAARVLEVVGYSMPDDDVEIRTLLRAGVLRGTSDPQLIIRNPAPDVHRRVREVINSEARSNYTPVQAI